MYFLSLFRQRQEDREADISVFPCAACFSVVSVDDALRDRKPEAVAVGVCAGLIPPVEALEHFLALLLVHLRGGVLQHELGIVPAAAELQLHRARRGILLGIVQQDLHTLAQGLVVSPDEHILFDLRHML